MNKNFIQKRTFKHPFVFLTLLTLLFLPFLLCAKVSAVDLQINAVPTNKILNVSNNFVCQTLDGTWQALNNNTCTIINNSNYKAFGLSPDLTIDVKKGNFYAQTFYILSNSTYFPIPNGIGNVMPDGWQIISFKQDWQESEIDYCKATTSSGIYYLPQNNIHGAYYADGGIVLINEGQSANQSIQFGTECDNAQATRPNWYVASYTIVATPYNDGQLNWSIGRWNSTDYIFRNQGQTFYFQNVIEYTTTSLQQINEAENRTQEATDEGQQNADSAESQNEQASQSLLQTAGDIVSVFSSPATNCSLNADMGNLDLGSINFCQDKPPSIMAVIDAVSSIIVTFAVFRIIRSLVTRFISLSSYGQGGSDG